VLSSPIVGAALLAGIALALERANAAGFVAGALFAAAIGMWFNRRAIREALRRTRGPRSGWRDYPILAMEFCLGSVEVLGLLVGAAWLARRLLHISN